jgi:hypothetical protein
MNQYFKFQSDSDLGVGFQYIEFDDRGWAIRQAECYGERWFNSIETYHKELGSIGLCDQQLTEAGMEIGDCIDVEEFELAWKISNRELVESHLIVNKLTAEKSQKSRYYSSPWLPIIILISFETSAIIIMIALVYFIGYEKTLIFLNF